jgi:hypothetical protein
MGAIRILRIIEVPAKAFRKIRLPLKIWKDFLSFIRLSGDLKRDFGVPGIISVPASLFS